MKRSEIIDLLKQTISIMDGADGAVFKDKRTLKTVGTIPKGDIDGMQTALVFCEHLLDGSYEESNPLRLITAMLDIHGACKFGLDDEDSDD